MVDRRSSRTARIGGVALGLAVAGILLAAAPAAAQTAADRPTFTKDIAPILQKSCQQCHRPDSIAPMSLLTYEQVRPYARAIKQRTQLAYVPGQRGVMPPWLYERNVGVQKLKEDQRLSDAEIALIARWVDSGAPQGSPADLPPPATFSDNSRWFVGKPDLIVSSPPVLVKGVGPDWWGDFGETPSVKELTEDRYASSVEYKEVSDMTKSAGLLRSNSTAQTYAGQGKTSIFVFHHGSATALRPAESGQPGEDAEAAGGGNLSLHEVGRNGDVFADDAGKLVPRAAVFSWNAHLHSPGIPGADRNAVLQIGLRFHPRGYKPTFTESNIQIASTEIEIRPDSTNQRYDAYWVAPQPLKLLNFEPHLHATGMRMCLEAIYQRSIETIGCSGYDHNWVRNYQFDDNHTPILPKGTILHTISWFDGTAKNSNIIEPRNTTVWGRRSVQNMLGTFNKAFYLTEEQYQAELARRRDYLTKTNTWNEVVGCPQCFDAPAAQQAQSR
jgi:mono/diheme cytochrome c family protein